MPCVRENEPQRGPDEIGAERDALAGNIFVYELDMAPQTPLGNRIHRHIAAARAFHTDLIAEAQRRLRILTNLARHLSILRSRESTLTERLSAADASCEELETLEQLRRSSVSTHRDLRNAVKRIHYHLNRPVVGKRPARNRVTLPSARAADSG